MFIFCLPFLGMGQVEFTASTNAKQVLEGGFFEIEFELANARGSNFKPPSFKNFNVVSGPQQSMSTQFINGSHSSTISYTYGLQAKKKGKYFIGPATILFGKKTLNTQPIKIEVLPKGAASSKKNPNQKEDFYIRAEVDTNVAFVGQQLIMDYVLYTTVAVENYAVLNAPEYEGFYTRVLRVDGKVTRVIKDGRQYSRKVLRRLALFPQQAGRTTIGPYTMRLGIAKPGSGRQRGFSFFTPTQQHTVATEPMEILIKSNPPNSPASFSGAAGEVRMITSIDKVTLTTDDAISLKMQVSGSCDLKRLIAPELSLPEGLEAYDPTILSENELNGRIGMLSEKMFEYLIVPNEPGYYTIIPEFTFLDPDSAKYVSRRDTHKVRITQGSLDKKRAIAQKKAESERKQIRDIKTDIAVIKQSDDFAGSGLFWSLYFLPLLLLGGGLWYKRKVDERNNIDPALLKSMRAKQVAQDKLKTAESYMKQGNARSFYDEISKALFGYTADKLKILPSGFSKHNIQGKLQSLNVSDANVEKFMKLLQSCEVALFAGQADSQSMNEKYEDAMNVIASIEEDLL